MCTSPSALVMPNSLLGNASQQKEMTETAWCKVTDVFVVVVVDWCRSPLFLSFPCCQLLVFYLRVKMCIAECWLAPPEQRGYHSAQEVCTFCRHLLMLMLLMPFAHRVSEHKQRRRFSVVLIHREQKSKICALCVLEICAHSEGKRKPSRLFCHCCWS